jgi:hypothetical protein
MGVIRKWLCVTHGPFECSHPICRAMGCDSRHVSPWTHSLNKNALGDWHGEASQARQAALSDAQAFLHQELKEGPKPSKDLLRRAGEAGHAEITVRRAKRALAIQAVKSGGRFDSRTPQQWRWRLPKG